MKLYYYYNDDDYYYNYDDYYIDDDYCYNYYYYSIVFYSLPIVLADPTYASADDNTVSIVE
jgi:hypothetical protein